MLDRQLPGGAGLREADRTFLVQLAPGDLGAAPAVAELLSSMGCTIVANGHKDVVLGHLAGKLLPAPELSPVRIRSADCCSAAELAAVAAMKLCTRCGQVKEPGDFPVLAEGQGLPRASLL